MLINKLESEKKVMAEGVEFCAFLSTRYLNSKLMGPAHDWVAANMPELPRGLIRMRSFHMAPDRGMTIMWFNNQKNLDEAFPGLKEFQKALASRFEARCDAQKGITSKEFDFGD